MHPWAETFKSAARGLSDREREVLSTPAAAKPAFVRVKNDVSGIVSSDQQGMMQIFGEMPTFAGPPVTPETAMRLSTVYRATALLAGAVATMPLPVFRQNDDGTRDQARDHPVRYLLNEEPTPRFTAATFWEFITGSMLLRGDGFAVLIRDGAGNVKEVIPVPSECVTVKRDDNRLIYVIWSLYNDNYSVDIRPFALDQDDVLHFPGFGFNGLRSMSVIRWAAYQAIGSALAMEQYAGNMMRNGAMHKIALVTPNDMDKDQIDKLRSLWEERYGGSSNSGRPMVLYGGMDAKTLTLTAKDAQLLESRNFQVEDIARAFGVPPWMVGLLEKTTSWGTGVEQMGIGFLIYTLMPHLNRFQQEINRKCFRISRYFCEFNTDGLLQADAKGRSDAFRQAIGGSQGPGWMLINEVRAKLNLKPIEDGNTLFTPSATNGKGGPSSNGEDNAQ
jgi:HK97 family phage portal protein